MILDRIKNYRLYSDINPSISKALQYIKDTDFRKRKVGKFEIEGDDIFSIVSEYKTKDLEDCRLEAHRKYIDIHYMSEGTELIGYSLLDNHEQATQYDSENDFILYCGDKNYLKLEEGMFAIFFPTDLHMPGIMVDKPALVKKIVIKVKLQEIKYTLI
ncbi:MAG TPA: YhcH/YjgK/YiaL family protein [Ignavibacteriaceae bacterium]|nr:YhcH/YjgK/YiaL family protein [Ignavibacteriaceae bacterium]